jgi:radical SAM superfamily enzyme YgiQ (UPF0313 family)
VRFVDQLEYYAQKGHRSFVFYDDTFTCDQKRARKICREILARKLKISWKCFTRADRVDDELLKWMKDAGCYYINFGCESFNDKTLELLKKGFTTAQSLEAIDLVHRAGMIACSSFMLGLPDETIEDIEHTIKTACASDLTFAVFPIFEPLEGTPIYETCKSKGTWSVDSRYTNSLLRNQEAIWVPNTIARAEIERLGRSAFKGFYFAPKRFPRYASILARMPWARKVRCANAALDYLVFSRFRRLTRGGRYV